ncbi:MAG: hypothetical protein KDK37_02580 [Leptospiraceae bacterium]|nr:hypothetical protein [Leptospiraceae bacterium]
MQRVEFLGSFLQDRAHAGIGLEIGDATAGKAGYRGFLTGIQGISLQSSME